MLTALLGVSENCLYALDFTSNDTPMLWGKFLIIRGAWVSNHSKFVLGLNNYHVGGFQ
jgi:hypothetical protein